MADLEDGAEGDGVVDEEVVLAALRQRISDALADGLPGEVLTRWVALVEVLGQDGSRGVWAVTSDGLMAWDVLGLLAYGASLEQANIIRDTMDA